MTFDPTVEFALWYSKNHQPVPPADAPIHRYNGLTSIVMYRQGDYQVELFILDPDLETPDHAHPNVDSVEIFFCGDLYFRHLKTLLTTHDQCQLVQPNGVQQLHGSMWRVRENESHGVSSGPRGCSFLSVQRWLNGVKPHSVGKDWIDDATGNTFNKDVA